MWAVVFFKLKMKKKKKKSNFSDSAQCFSSLWSFITTSIPRKKARHSQIQEPKGDELSRGVLAQARGQAPAVTKRFLLVLGVNEARHLRPLIGTERDSKNCPGRTCSCPPAHRLSGRGKGGAFLEMLNLSALHLSLRLHTHFAQELQLSL